MQKPTVPAAKLWLRNLFKSSILNSTRYEVSYSESAGRAQFGRIQTDSRLQSCTRNLRIAWNTERIAVSLGKLNLNFHKNAIFNVPFTIGDP
jgi:hypothetical protein